MQDVELMVESLAIGIGSSRADSQFTVRTRVVKGDGLGDGIVGVETVVVRLAIEVGVEVDGLVVRGPANMALDVREGSVGGILYVCDPGPSYHPCNRRQRFGRGR